MDPGIHVGFLNLFDHRCEGATNLGFLIDRIADGFNTIAFGPHRIFHNAFDSGWEKTAD